MREECAEQVWMGEKKQDQLSVYVWEGAEWVCVCVWERESVCVQDKCVSDQGKKERDRQKETKHGKCGGGWD